MKKKWELKKIIKVEVHPKFNLVCTFDDNVVKNFSMNQIITCGGPMAKPLKKQSYFKKVFLEMGTLTWPNGYDVCSDLVYAQGTELQFIKRGKKFAA
ncbi:MAG: DUF2442 domain-containing protein [Oligoflexia bacterium]|nr:DUF2442 domain-containing protein [Oligoflexia bacterium]